MTGAHLLPDSVTGWPGFKHWLGPWVRSKNGHWERKFLALDGEEWTDMGPRWRAWRL